MTLLRERANRIACFLVSSLFLIGGCAADAGESELSSSEDGLERGEERAVEPLRRDPLKVWKCPPRRADGRYDSLPSNRWEDQFVSLRDDESLSVIFEAPGGSPAYGPPGLNSVSVYAVRDMQSMLLDTAAQFTVTIERRDLDSRGGRRWTVIQDKPTINAQNGRDWLHARAPSTPTGTYAPVEYRITVRVLGTGSSKKALFQIEASCWPGGTI